MLTIMKILSDKTNSLGR